MVKSNFPTRQLEDLPSDVVKTTVKSLSDLYQMGKPETDAEVQERIDKYFAFCEASSLRPGIESLALSLCVSRTTLFNWQNGIGCSKERQDIIIKAKLFVSAFLEQIMLNNKVYPGTGIFLLKNWCNYRDAVEIESQNSQSSPAMTQAEIQSIAKSVSLMPDRDIAEIVADLPD